MRVKEFSSVAKFCPTLCDPVDCSTPGFPVHHQLPELAQIHCPSSWWCHPTISFSVVPFSSCLHSFPASGSFPTSVLHIRWPKYWSFSFSISPSNEFPGLISFRIDLCDFLAVQGTLKSLLQHHSLERASALRRSAFFVVQLSHPHMTTEKTIALTRQTFVDKVMSLLFNMLSSLVIAFLPRTKCLLISWLQSPSAVILETKKIKSRRKNWLNLAKDLWVEMLNEQDFDVPQESKTFLCLYPECKTKWSICPATGKVWALWVGSCSSVNKSKKAIDLLLKYLQAFLWHLISVVHPISLTASEIL